jgi:hypothetical protein
MPLGDEYERMGDTLKWVLVTGGCGFMGCNS